MRLVSGISVAGAAILAAVGALAAELPTMKPAPSRPARSCPVGGMAGVIVAGSGLCVRVGGYVSGGVELGSVRPQFNGAAQSGN